MRISRMHALPPMIWVSKVIRSNMQQSSCSGSYPGCSPSFRIQRLHYDSQALENFAAVLTSPIEGLCSQAGICMTSQFEGKNHSERSNAVERLKLAATLVD